MTGIILRREQILEAAERTRDALAELAITAEATNDYSASRAVLEESGLGSIRVPAAAGGPGASQAEAFDAVRILSQADAGVAQLLQPQFAFTDSVVFLPASSQKKLYAEILTGARIGNAASERGGKHSADFRSTLTPAAGGGYRVNGTKYYATGSVGATWLTVIAANAEGQQALAYVRADSPGIEIRDDWNGLGQRGSGSGTVVFTDVVVAEDHVIDPWDVAHRPAAWHTAGRFVHAAIDIGIAEGAFRYGVDSILENPNRVPFELVYTSLVDDPTLRALVGRASARIRAGRALLREASRVLDDLQAAAGAGADTAHLDTEVSQALSATKAIAAELALDVGSGVFEWTGARQADGALRADRFWRNARTHTLHDPVRLRYDELGAAELSRPDRQDPIPTATTASATGAITTTPGEPA